VFQTQLGHFLGQFLAIQALILRQETFFFGHQHNGWYYLQLCLPDGVTNSASAACHTLPLPEISNKFNLLSPLSSQKYLHKY
jgi:hypothetical protein